MKSSNLLSFVIKGLLLAGSAVANECRPATWGRKRDGVVVGTDALRELFGRQAPGVIDLKPPAPGEINCRQYGRTEAEVNYYTCTQMAEKYEITIDKFFLLNPAIDKECKSVKPKTMYCVAGFIEPIRAWDGLCGPNHKNATCLGTDKGQCCNSETWTCSDSEEACRPGTCWGGACEGADKYSLTGKCGPKNGGLLCGGKWGDCCGFDGNCGTREKGYCDAGRCESGNCTFLTFPPPMPTLPIDIGLPVSTSSEPTSSSKTSSKSSTTASTSTKKA